MKYKLVILTLLIAVGLKDTFEKTQNSLIGKKFHNFKQIDELANYEKISDTVVYEDRNDPQFGILHLENKKNNLIIFNKIYLDSLENRIFEIVDTLVIENLKKNERITIGYCQFDNNNEENLIAIVNKYNKINIKKVKRLWAANTQSNKIELVSNRDGINCLNEWFVE